jgi:hypothetical protein
MGNLYTYAETQTVTEYRCRYRDKIYVLLDTPGFGDTYRSNDDVVDEVLQWLASSYRAETRLNGVIYLHPINDIRMQGSARENLEMFRKLCGEDALKNVLFVSTFWDTVDEAQGVRNEEQLRSKDEFWGRMVKKGSKVRRYNSDDLHLALAILDDIDHGSHCVLRAQEEIVIDGKDPRQTEAATFNFEAMRAEMEAQIQEAEERAKQVLEEQQKAAQEQARRIEEQRQWLRAQEEEAKRREERLEAEERQLQEEERAREHRDFCERMRQEVEARERILAAVAAAQEEEKQKMQKAKAEYYRDYACIGREVSRDDHCDRCNETIRHWYHWKDYYRKYPSRAPLTAYHTT